MNLKINLFAILLSINLPLFAQTESKSINDLIVADDLKALKEKVQKGEKIPNDVTLLQTAVENCNDEMVQYLLENGVKPGEKYEGSPLSYISFCHSQEPCRIKTAILLIEYGNPFSNQTLAYLYCGFDIEEKAYLSLKPITETLIKKGLKVNDALMNTGVEEEEYYLTYLCSSEKDLSQNYGAKSVKYMREYILFLAKNGVDFQRSYKEGKPYDLLSTDMQKKLKTMKK